MREHDTFEQTLTRSDSTLRRRACALCDQRLDRAKRGHCGAIWNRDSCRWVEGFRAQAAGTGREGI